MGLIARLSRVVPLALILAVVAIIIYLVVSWRRSPERAKEVLIKVFTVLCSALSIFFLIVSLYALFEGNGGVLDLGVGFLAVALIGLGITRWCRYRFLKHHPHYRKKRMPASTKRRGR